MDTPASFDAPRLRFPRRTPDLTILRVRVATGVLWVLIALAALGGLRGLVSHPAPARPPAVAPAAVAGFAGLYVATYLEAGAGQEQAVAAYYPGPLDLTGVAAGARYVARAAAVATEALGPGYWAVIVGADVLAASPAGYQPEGTRYYRVAVKSGVGGLVATALPGAVAAPVPGRVPDLAVPAVTALPTATVPDPAISAAVAGYLARALGVTATVAALALSPPAGGERLAVARVTATDAAGIPEVLDYTLRLGHKGNRWVPGAVLPAPPLAGAQLSPEQPGSGAPNAPDKEGGTQ